CSHCHGSGAKDENSKKTCQTCSGRGTVRNERRTAFGVFVQTDVCPDCHGTGEIITEECPHCHGHGNEKKKKKILVKVPKGVREDSVISIRGEGSVGKNGGPNGDLNVYVDIRENNKFK
ncbi:MAG: zinc finger domain-containing protein, partial [Fenollaria timonensis]